MATITKEKDKGTATKGVEPKKVEIANPVQKKEQAPAKTKSYADAEDMATPVKTATPTTPAKKEQPAQKPQAPIKTTKTGKERRTARREEKAKDLIKRESAERGIDFDSLNKYTNQPTTEEEKKAITDKILAGVKDTGIKESIESLGESVLPPTVEENADPEKLKAALIESAKRQRSARWADALYAFGEGLQGKTANREALTSTRLERERNKQFQDYKDVTERNRKNKVLWEDKYRKEMLDHLYKQLDNKRLNEKQEAEIQNAIDKIEIEREKAKTESRKVGTYEKRNQLIEEGKWYNQRGSSARTATKEPKYLDTYNSLSQGDMNALNVYAESLGVKLDERGKERVAKAMIDNLYTKTTAEDGTVSYKPNPGAAELLQELSSIAEDRKRLTAAIEAEENRAISDKDDYNTKNKKLDSLKAELGKLDGRVAKAKENAKAIKPSTANKSNKEGKDLVSEFFK